jgi:hypothetical protein
MKKNFNDGKKKLHSLHFDDLIHLLAIESVEFPPFVLRQVHRAELLVESLGRIPVEHVKVEAAALLVRGKLYVLDEELLADAVHAIVGLHVDVLHEVCLALPCRVREEADRVADHPWRLLVLADLGHEAVKKWRRTVVVEVAVTEEIGRCKLRSVWHFLEVCELLKLKLPKIIF